MTVDAPQESPAASSTSQATETSAKSADQSSPLRIRPRPLWCRSRWDRPSTHPANGQFSCTKKGQRIISELSIRTRDKPISKFYPDTAVSFVGGSDEYWGNGMLIGYARVSDS